MTRSQGLLAVLTCVLLLAWVAGGRRSPMPRLAAVSGPPQIHAADPAIDAIGRQAARVRDLRASAPPPLAPSRRNLFQFREVAPAARRHAAVLGSAGPVDRPTRPEMRLVGIAEDVRDGATVRTAIVSAMAQVFFVREGDRLLGRYDVVRVAAEAVQVKDGETTFTLAMK